MKVAAVAAVLAEMGVLLQPLEVLVAVGVAVLVEMVEMSHFQPTMYSVVAEAVAVASDPEPP